MLDLGFCWNGAAVVRRSKDHNPSIRKGNVNQGSKYSYHAND
jgi:hypothetical protein